MMADPEPFGGSFLEDLKGPSDNRIQQQSLNSGFSSLSFGSSSNIPNQSSVNIPMSPQIPMTSTVGGPYRNFVPQDESQNYPSSPMSPVFRQQSTPEMSRHASSSDNSQGQGRTNNFDSSPSKYSHSPVLNTPISLDGRPLNNQQHYDPLDSFLPPPPNLDTSSHQQQIGRVDNSNGFFLSENNSIHSRSPFAPSDTIGQQGNFDNNSNRERALSSSGLETYRQPSLLGANNHNNNMSSPQGAPSSQILHEDRPSSWNDGSGFPAPNMFRSEGPSSSPSNYDRFNSRPPRHNNINMGTKETQAILSPRIQEIRHAASDGNFTMPSMMPLTGPVGPMGNNNQGRFQPSQPSYNNNMGSGVIGSGNSQGGGSQFNDRHSFGNMNDLNSNNNFQQQNQHYQMPQASHMPPGMINPNMQQFVHQSPIPPNLHRTNSTGSSAQHFLVNERGEIVGHASPIITQQTYEGYPPGYPRGQAEPRNNNFPPPGSPNRPQRSHSVGGPMPMVGMFNQIQPQQGNNLNPIGMDGRNNASSNPVDNTVGSIGDGRMQHQRNNTEPTPVPVTLLNQNSSGTNLQISPQVSSASDTLEQSSHSVENIVVKKEETKSPIGAVVEAPVAVQPGATLSYAAKLMMPKPPPAAVDQTKGQVSSQAMTAGSGNPKSGPRQVYSVKFKRSQRNFILGPRVQREVKIGCYVKVEADRGEDLGIVMGIIPMEKYVASNNRQATEDSTATGDSAASSQAINISDMKRIMRAATNDEISLLEVKRDEEDELLKICSTKVKQRGLPMTVVDAEYQYDRNKLTFFFQAEGRVDFRELVRDLFSIYKTRIWMEQTDKGGSPVDDDE